jgi:hypothetical protein
MQIVPADPTICSEIDDRHGVRFGCGPLEADGSEPPPQEATAAILACPICGDDAPRCYYHWEEHVEDHTRLGAQLVAHNHGYFALDRGDGWYDAVTEDDAATRRPAAYLTVLAEEYDADESRIPPPLRAGLVELDGLRADIEAAWKDDWESDDFAGIVAFVRSRRQLLARLHDAAMNALEALGQAARVGRAEWKAECARADRANGCRHRGDRDAYCPACGWSRHQTWCYTDRCPWCGSTESPCAQCAAGDTGVDEGEDADD